jgi:hypothetical protein
LNIEKAPKSTGQGEEMKTKIAVITALWVAMTGSTGWSMCPVDKWVNEKADSAGYGTKAGGMALRGLHDIVKSPTELLIHPYQESRNHLDNGLGILRGLGTGVFRTLEHAVIGVMDIVSAPVPNYHGIKSEDQHEWGKKA